MIYGIEFRELNTHDDERGFFREVIRHSDTIFQGQFGQLSHSLVQAGVIKAWHLHRMQTDWWYIAAGLLRVGLYDTREESPTYRQTMDFLMGDGQPPRLLKIPPGVVHGYRVLNGPAHVIYITSHIYNPEDELRIPEDDDEIGFDWKKTVVIP